MAKKPKGRDPALEAAEGRFRDWCRRKIAADPRYAHVIVEDMVALYGGSGERYATADAVLLLTELGERVADETRRDAARAAGARGGRRPKKNAAARWQTPALEREVREHLDVESDLTIAKRLAGVVYRDVETIRKFVARVRRTQAANK